MINIMQRKKAGFGGLSIVLTIVLIALVILFNVLFQGFANKFLWYIDMTENAIYSLSDDCADQLKETIPKLTAPSDQVKPIRIIFLDSPDNLNSEVTQRYVYNTAKSLEGLLPEYISVSWIDIWTYPESVKIYKEQFGRLQSTMVVIDCGEHGFRVLRLNEFFHFLAADSENPVGYNGDSKFASAIVGLLSQDKATCYLTTNHGETYYDTQLLMTLVDAGYTLSYLNLLQEAIPDKCDLLLLFNPTADLTIADGVSQMDERVKLDAYMAEGGKMMVFLSDSMQNLPNLEAFLSDWNVEMLRHTNSEGTSYPYMIKDPSASLTSDGSTIVGKIAATGLGSEWLAQMTTAAYQQSVIFKNATAMQITDKNPAVKADPVFVSNANAEAWSAGALVRSGEAFNLMTISSNDATGAKLLVSTSSASASEDYMMSVVFGNREVIQRICIGMGKQDVMIDIDYKPFSDSTIHSITTAAMARWTVILTAVPALIVVACGVIILVRRKNV
ncbi:MAG: Gldg family protein [Clostridia bacterium]|nr:Gldg family protein [Clostridia bacterium]MBQ7727837.1 Gldg family protein [Clostridia bacterium]